jgi:hypothetical protein
MKNIAILSLFITLLVGAPAFAENAPSQNDTKVVKANALTKKQKIEAELRSTKERISLVVERTQKIVNLLDKNGKDTQEVSDLLVSSRNSLSDFDLAIDQYAGVIPEESKEDKDTKKTKEIVIFKDPLKKAQESLKSARGYLVESIKILKEGLSEKETSEE